MELRKKQELLDQELALARNIQSSMLPDYVPDIPSLDIIGFSQPAAAVGATTTTTSRFPITSLAWPSAMSTATVSRPVC